MLSILRVRQAMLLLPPKIVRAGSTMNRSHSRHVTLSIILICLLTNTSRSGASIDEITFPVGGVDLDQAEKLHPNFLLLKHTFQETKVHTTAPYRERPSPRSAFYSNWRHTDYFGLTAVASGRQRKSLAVGAAHEKSKLRFDPYQASRRKNSSFRVGLYANNTARRTALWSTTINNAFENKSSCSKAPLVDRANEKQGVDEKPVTEGIRGAVAEKCKEPCERCVEQTSGAMNDADTAEIDQGEYARSEEADDAVWGRCSYPYSRIF